MNAAGQYSTLRIVALVGGLAPQKQIRLLDGRPDIVVATPGRLQELVLETQHEYLSRLDLLQVCHAEFFYWAYCYESNVPRSLYLLLEFEQLDVSIPPLLPSLCYMCALVC